MMPPLVGGSSNNATVLVRELLIPKIIYKIPYKRGRGRVNRRPRGVYSPRCTWVRRGGTNRCASVLLTGSIM